MNATPIVVVDDNEFIRASLIKFLQSNRYNVVGFSHASDAIIYLKEHSASMVITDVLMPDTDGFQLVDFIKDDARLSTIPIIAISGGGRSLDATSVLSALEEKVNYVMKKPFGKQDLLDKVASLV